MAVARVSRPEAIPPLLRHKTPGTSNQVLILGSHKGASTGMMILSGLPPLICLLRFVCKSGGAEKLIFVFELYRQATIEMIGSLTSKICFCDLPVSQEIEATFHGELRLKAAEFKTDKNSKLFDCKGIAVSMVCAEHLEMTARRVEEPAKNAPGGKGHRFSVSLVSDSRDCDPSNTISDAFDARWTEKVQANTDLTFVGRDVAKDLHDNVKMFVGVSPLQNRRKRQSSRMLEIRSPECGGIAGLGRTSSYRGAEGEWCRGKSGEVRRAACVGWRKSDRNGTALSALGDKEAQSGFVSGLGTEKETICYADQ